MSYQIKRLGSGDEAMLTQYIRDIVDFDLDHDDKPKRPLAAAAAQRYLANPAVLHWVAYTDDTVIGSLYCAVLPLPADDGQELVLYEIGVRSAWRRKGVGRALLDEMDRWMRDNGVGYVWVLADNDDAIAFYQSGGFEAEDEQPVYMAREL
ncbi:MAG: GNAT family N-acetyltransferase [Anaerolineae bacterium]|nr:GNAT family N-acetyltransferase [Anaerolineae bacterium]